MRGSQRGGATNRGKLGTKTSGLHDMNKKSLAGDDLTRSCRAPGSTSSAAGGGVTGGEPGAGEGLPWGAPSPTASGPVFEASFGGGSLTVVVTLKLQGGGR